MFMGLRKRVFLCILAFMRAAPQFVCRDLRVRGIAERPLSARQERLQLDKTHRPYTKITIGSNQSCFNCGASGIDRLLFCGIFVIVGFPIEQIHQYGSPQRMFCKFNQKSKKCTKRFLERSFAAETNCGASDGALESSG